MYGRCPKILNTLLHTNLAQILLFMQVFPKISSGIANRVNSLISVYTVCICRFVRHFGVQNFRTFAVNHF